MAMGERFTVEVDGARIVGEAAGEGLAVVFLHANVADRRMWASQMAAVAGAGFKAVAYDRRGYGETEAEDVAFSHLGDLEAVLDHLGIHAAIVVGNSMGGAIAVDWALDSPERTVGLVLVATGVYGMEEPEPDERVMPIIQAMQDCMERGDDETLNRVLAHAWLDGPLCPSGRVDGAVRDLFLTMNGVALAKPKLTGEEEPVSSIEHLEEIEVPVLLVVGGHDFPEVLSVHEDLADMLPNAFGTVIEDAAHLVPLERPDLFDPLLLEFLAAATGEGADG